MRRLIVLAFALLLSTPSFAHHPAPPPVPAPVPAPVSAPELVGTSPWLFVAMALPLVWFVYQHASQK